MQTQLKCKVILLATVVLTSLGALFGSLPSLAGESEAGVLGRNADPQTTELSLACGGRTNVTLQVNAQQVAFRLTGLKPSVLRVTARSEAANAQPVELQIVDQFNQVLTVGNGGVVKPVRGKEPLWLVARANFVSDVAYGANGAFDVTISTEAIDNPFADGWTDDFTSAKAFAETNNIPLVVIWGNTSCDYCNKLVEVLDDPGIWDALESHPAITVCKHEELGSKSADYLAARDWIKAINPSLTGYPYVGISWKKPSGEVVQTAFTGRPGEIPAGGNTVPEALANVIKGTLHAFSTAEVADGRYDNVWANGYFWDVVIENGEAALMSSDGVSPTVYPNPVGELELPDEIFGLPLRTIGYDAFANCGELTTIVIPDSVLRIEQMAFIGCVSLEEVVGARGLVSIGPNAFACCGNLTTFYLADSVSNIDYAAFWFCHALCTLHIMDLNPHFCEKNGMLLTKDGRELVACLGSLESATVPDTVEVVRACGFGGQDRLREILLPDSVLEIHSYAFECCSALTNVVIGASVRVLVDHLFSRAGESGQELSVRFRGDAPAYALGWVYSEELMVAEKALKEAAQAVDIARTAYLVTGGIGEAGMMAAKELAAAEAALQVAEAAWQKLLEQEQPQEVPFPYADAPANLVSYVRAGSKGWLSEQSTDLPDLWPVGPTNGRPIQVWSDMPPITRTVIFELGDAGVRTGGGALTQQVATATAAEPPTVATVNDSIRFAGWSEQVDRVLSNRVVYALYEDENGEPVPANRPGPVEWVEVSQDLAGEIQIWWADADNATEYRIWCATRNDFSKATVIGVTRESYYVDNDVTVDPTYHYWIEARNKLGSSMSEASEDAWCSPPLVIAPTVLSPAKELEEYECQLEATGGSGQHYWYPFYDSYRVEYEDSTFEEVGEKAQERRWTGEWGYEFVMEGFKFLFGGRAVTRIQAETMFPEIRFYGRDGEEIGYCYFLHTPRSLGFVMEEDLFVAQGDDKLTLRWKGHYDVQPDEAVNFSVTISAGGIIRFQFGEGNKLGVYFCLSDYANDFCHGIYSPDEPLTFAPDAVFYPCALPDGLELDGDGLISGVPTDADNYQFRVILEDDVGSYKEQDLILSVVENENKRPVIESLVCDDESGLLKAGKTYHFTATAVDPEGRELTYVWYLDDEEMDETGPAFTYEPTYDDCGWHDLRCVVSDDLWQGIVQREYSFVVCRDWFVDQSDCGEGDGSSWDSALWEIQDAIDMAGDYDDIYVRAGVYLPVYDPEWACQLKIHGVDGPESTIIDGEGQVPCADFYAYPIAYRDGMDMEQPTRRTTFDGFTFANGVWCGVYGVCLERCIIRDCQGTGAHGCILRSCLISQNCLTDELGLSPAGLSSCRAYNCTVVDNSDETEDRVGVGASVCDLYNCIIVGNADAAESQVKQSWMQNCCVPVDCAGDNFKCENSVVDDPMFVNAENGDYRLLAGSPCIDAGGNDMWSGDLDLAGNVRRQGQSLDIGAYEGGCVIGERMTEDGIRWTYETLNGEAVITGFEAEGESLQIVVPSELDGYRVVAIGDEALAWRNDIVSVTVPGSVRKIGAAAFAGCERLTSLSLGEGVSTIGESAFAGCYKLWQVVLPKSVSRIGDWAFEGCDRLARVDILNPTVRIGEGAFGWSDNLVIHVPTDWRGPAELDEEFVVVRDLKTETPSPDPGRTSVSLTVTNVVVQYVLNSIQPEIAVPQSPDVGFVNVITEIKGGSVAVPSTWTDDYPAFKEKFGSDFTRALTKPTGKKDGAGNAMLVWQDYVAGTDPTDEDDKFTASVTLVDGKVVVSYTPEFKDAAARALRVYTTWGKKSLLDAEWTKVPDGQEGEYNFFKVTVEMK